VFERDLIAVCSCRGDPNNVDVDAATKAGVPVLRAPGRNADAVAEITVALLLAATRGIVAADHDVRTGEVYKDGTIPYQRFRAWQIAGRTAGLVGLGAVGRATKWRLEGLGMHVISADPFAPDATSSLEELLARSDVVSMHVGVNPDTVGMIGAAQFDQMPDGAVFINSARAQLHDNDALVAALTSGKLSAAGLDHFEGEFLALDHPLVSMSNVVLTPHIGGATYDTEVNHTRIIAEDIVRLLAGALPLNCVNPEVLDRRDPEN
jgi:D-3-phosphoglycerate dehydrogenase